MSKDQNDKFKEIKDIYSEFQKLMSKELDRDFFGFRQSENLTKLAQIIYSLAEKIDEDEIYDSNVSEFRFIIYEVTKHLGVSLLRKNHYFLDGDKEVSVFYPENVEELNEIVKSKDEIIDSIEFFKKALSCIQKIDETKYMIEINQIYHNLCEAYQSLGDHSQYLRYLELSAENNDVRGICETIDYYCSLDAFYDGKIFEYYEKLKTASRLILERQKSDGVSSYLNDIEKQMLKDFTKIHLRSYYESQIGPIHF